MLNNALRLVMPLFFTTSLLGQVFRIAPAVASPGTTVEVQISLESPAGREPAALQWKTTFSTQQMTAIGNPIAGPAAKAAGKAITCSGQSVKGGETYAYACILAGGLKPLRNGIVALLTFRVPDNARLGPVPIRVEGEGATAEAKKVAIAPANGAVTVR